MIDIKESKGNKLEGVLYDITDDTAVIFDNVEKVSQGKHKRIGVRVENMQGDIIETQTFISTVKQEEFAPSKQYIDIIIEGAKINRLSGQHINYLRTFIE